MGMHTTQCSKPSELILSICQAPCSTQAWRCTHAVQAVLEACSLTSRDNIRHHKALTRDQSLGMRTSSRRTRTAHLGFSRLLGHGAAGAQNGCTGEVFLPRLNHSVGAQKAVKRPKP